jgi:hypothetical protein
VSTTEELLGRKSSTKRIFTARNYKVSPHVLNGKLLYSILPGDRDSALVVVYHSGSQLVVPVPLGARFGPKIILVIVEKSPKKGVKIKSQNKVKKF